LSRRASRLTNDHLLVSGVDPESEFLDDFIKSPLKIVAQREAADALVPSPTVY